MKNKEILFPILKENECYYRKEFIIFENNKIYFKIGTNDDDIGKKFEKLLEISEDEIKVFIEGIEYSMKSNNNIIEILKNNQVINIRSIDSYPEKNGDIKIQYFILSLENEKGIKSFLSFYINKENFLKSYWIFKDIGFVDTYIEDIDNDKYTGRGDIKSLLTNKDKWNQLGNMNGNDTFLISKILFGDGYKLLDIKNNNLYFKNSYQKIFFTLDLKNQTIKRTNSNLSYNDSKIFNKETFDSNKILYLEEINKFFNNYSYNIIYENENIHDLIKNIKNDQKLEILDITIMDIYNTYNKENQIDIPIILFLVKNKINSERSCLIYDILDKELVKTLTIEKNGENYENILIHTNIKNDLKNNIFYDFGFDFKVRQRLIISNGEKFVNLYKNFNFNDIYDLKKNIKIYSLVKDQVEEVGKYKYFGGKILYNLKEKNILEKFFINYLNEFDFKSFLKIGLNLNNFEVYKILFKNIDDKNNKIVDQIIFKLYKENGRIVLIKINKKVGEQNKINYFFNIHYVDMNIYNSIIEYIGGENKNFLFFGKDNDYSDNFWVLDKNLNKIHYLTLKGLKVNINFDFNEYEIKDEITFKKFINYQNLNIEEVKNLDEKKEIYGYKILEYNTIIFLKKDGLNFEYFLPNIIDGFKVKDLYKPYEIIENNIFEQCIGKIFDTNSKYKFNLSRKREFSIKGDLENLYLNFNNIYFKYKTNKCGLDDKSFTIFQSILNHDDLFLLLNEKEYNLIIKKLREEIGGIIINESKFIDKGIFLLRLNLSLIQEKKLNIIFNKELIKKYVDEIETNLNNKGLFEN